MPFLITALGEALPKELYNEWASDVAHGHIVGEKLVKAFPVL